MKVLPPEKPDEDLLRLIVTEGDQKAFHTLFLRYWKKLYVKALVRLEDEEEARDCVQEVFLTIWNRRSEMSVPESVSGYLSVCVRNTVLNHLKSRAARLAREKEYAVTAYDRYAENNQLENEELSLFLNAEIEKMPEQMRRVFLLSREEYLSGGEIAEKLGMSHQTVRNQISLALKRLRLSFRQAGF